jgi:hypothetical protein
MIDPSRERFSRDVGAHANTMRDKLARAERCGNDALRARRIECGVSILRRICDRICVAHDALGYAFQCATRVEAQIESDNRQQLRLCSRVFFSANFLNLIPKTRNAREMCSRALQFRNSSFGV